MVWTEYFNQNPDPTRFNADVTLEVLNDFDQIQLNDFFTRVISTLNDEAKRISPQANYYLNDLTSKIVGYGGTASTNINKFNQVVEIASNVLEQQKSQTLTADNINKFYQKYYFKTPSQNEIDQLANNPYGLGAETQFDLKNQAIDTLVSYGVLIESDYNNLDENQRVAKLEAVTNNIDELRSIATRLNNNLIDKEKVELSPISAINALIQMKDQGVTKLNSNNTYSYSDGKGVSDLATIEDGKWLTSYQKLEQSWKDSGSQQPFSEYLATAQAFRAENERVTLDPNSEYGVNIRTALGETLADKISEQVGSPESKLNEVQAKIDKLKTDAYTQAFRQLNVYQKKEEQNKALGEGLSNSLSNMTAELSQDLGLKTDFFKIGGLKSSTTYSWQKWFEDELAKRYDPDNANNQISSVLGTASDEDISIASSFMKEYLQDRFDGSRSLSEFTSFINPKEATPILEQKSEVLWNKYSSDNYYSLLGAISDQNSNLGNFWNLLKNSWEKGQGFDAGYYKNQNIVDSVGKEQTVESFWSGIKMMNQKDIEKGTTDLKIEDFSEEELASLGASNEEELTKKVDEYRKWWNEAFDYGSDINNLEEFMKLHYNVYAKQSSAMGGLVQTKNNARLKISRGIAQESEERIQEMAERLASQATQYIDQIKYGKFTSAEEYVKKMMADNAIFDTLKGSVFEDSSELDMINQFNSDFSGVLSSFAGEQIRNNIRSMISQNKMPDQEALGVDYIQRTKAEALSTIENIIRDSSTSSAVIVSNVTAPVAGQSLSQWFSNLGLEVVPGLTWDRFKVLNNIPATTKLEDWEKQADSQVFWEQWAKDNGISYNLINGKVTLIVESPSKAWKTWTNSIVDGKKNQDPTITSALADASVELKEGILNKAWYSKTNPYTKVVDSWKSAVRNPDGKVVNTSTTNAWKWAKDNQVNPDGAWSEYVEEKRKTNSRFAKDAAGDDISFEKWSDGATSIEVDRFWRETNPYWIGYLQDQGMANLDSSSGELKVKTWGEWATANNVDLSTEALKSGTVPSAFLEFHYSALGGKDKVNEAYLDTYFPEFKLLEEDSKSTNLPFDLSSFGLDSISTDPKETLNSFNKSNPFKTINDQFGFDVGNALSVDNYSTKSTNNISGDFNFNVNTTSYNKKKTNNQFVADFDMSFGDFGGSGFGF